MSLALDQQFHIAAPHGQVFLPVYYNILSFFNSLCRLVDEDYDENSESDDEDEEYEEQDESEDDQSTAQPGSKRKVRLKFLFILFFRGNSILGYIRSFYTLSGKLILINNITNLTSSLFLSSTCSVEAAPLLMLISPWLGNFNNKK